MTIDVILLSGMGPSGLSDGDLIGTRFDRRFTDSDITEMYSMGDTSYDPLNLSYASKPVFRKSNKRADTLVTRVLESILNSHNIQFESLNLNLVWNSEKVDTKEAKVICLSTTFMWSEHMLNLALKWIRETFTYTHLVLGGKYASLKKEKLMEQHPEIDYIIVGDGETALPLLIKHLLSEDHNLHEIPNLIYRDEGKFVSCAVQEEAIEELPCTKYNKQQDVVMYESVRGCVFHCKFCAWSVGMERFRSKSAEKILAEWKTYINENGAKEIQVVDSTFFIPPQRMSLLLDQLPALNIKWKANARTDIPISHEFVRKLEKSGCVSLKFGFESMSDEVLRYIDKRSTAENNRRVNQYFKESSIDTIVSFIVGFPGETPIDFAETEAFILHELFGHFHLYIFELEDECMPIWEERDIYKLQVFHDKFDSVRPWEHGGTCWSHKGMTSLQAEELKKRLLVTLRKSKNLAVHRTWQGGFESPILPTLNRETNIKVEKLLDQLIYLPVDYKVHTEEYDRKLLDIVSELSDYGLKWSNN